MCGIAGAVGWVDDGWADAVERMNGAQVHRGPDDVGLFRSVQERPGRGAILGHRRLAIIDLSPLGHQPMIDRATGCVIAFNGEVYNFTELRARLRTEGVEFESRSDTEVVLKAYTTWGAGFVEELRGMFALAVWDPRSSQVFLARDRMGIKPLYVAKIEADGGRSTVLFASELRALLATGRVRRRLDRVALASYLWNGFVVGPNTIVEGISLLPAGATATISADGTLRHGGRYWSIPPERISPVDAEERLREATIDAIRMRLVADVPLGVFLSGGVDSSAVAAAASRIATGDAVKTFNVRFDEARFDESAHARAVAERLGTEHHELRLTEGMFRSGLDEALGSLDQPTFDAVNTYFISRAVREAGITVAIAGTGGDELFGGYPSFVDLPRARPISRVAGSLPAGVRRPLSGLVSRMKSGPRGTVAPQTRWGKLDDLLATRGDMASLYQVSYGLFTREFLDELGGSMDMVDHGVPIARMHELRALIAGRGPLEATSALELSLFLGERLLRDADCASMAVSLEVRVPLVDHVVLEAAAAVDSKARYHPLGAKQILRRLAEPELESEMFDRPKAGFELPIDVWSREGLRGDIDRLLGDPECARRVGLNGEAVGRIWAAYLDGAPGLYWTRVWSLYVLLRWTQEHDVSL